MIQVVGIDPSLTGTAVCLFGKELHDWGMRRFTSEPAAGLQRIKRFEDLVQNVLQVVRSSANVFIEGYSFGSPLRMAPLAEYGGILRYEMLGCVESVVEVPPSCLKKFATGKGNAKKMAVALACQKRWGVTYETDDEFDAYVLARIGRCYVGLEEPETAFQREVVEELKHGKAKRKAKSRVQ